MQEEKMQAVLSEDLKEDYVMDTERMMKAPETEDAVETTQHPEVAEELPNPIAAVSDEEADDDAAPIQSDVDEEDSSSNEPEIPVSIPTESEKMRQNAARRRERARKRRMEAPLDEYGRPILDDSFDESFAEISKLRSTRAVVDGYIEQVTRGRDGREGWAEVMYKDFRVLIPVSQMDITVENIPDETPEAHLARLTRSVSNMIGAKINFVITGVDADARMAAGSRLIANQTIRKNILNAQDRDGNYLIYSGRKVKGTVLSVHPNFAFVDVYGMRCRLPIRALRSDYVADINDILENGMSIPLYITQMERDENGEVIQMIISMRNDKAEKERLQNAALTTKPGDYLSGTVTGRTRKAIYLSLSNGLNGLVFISNGLLGRKVPNIGDKVSIRIIDVRENRGNHNPIVVGKIVRNINYIAR